MVLIFKVFYFLKLTLVGVEKIFFDFLNTVYILIVHDNVYWSIPPILFILKLAQYRKIVV